VMHAGSGAARVDSDTLLCSRTRRRCVLFSVGGVAGVWPIGWLASSASRWARRADGAVGGPLETHTHAGVVGSCVRRAGPCAVSAVACVGFFAVCCVMSGLGSAPATQGAPLRPKQRPSCRLARLAARARERMRMVLSRVRAVRGPTHACLRVLYTCSADHTIARTYRYGSYAHVGALWLCL